MRILAKVLGWLLGAVLTSIVIVVGFVVWRVGQGPIPLDFLTPRIEAEVKEIDPTMEVDIGTIVLLWDGKERQFELRAEQVKLGSGDQSVAVPGIAFGLETKALLHGELQLSYAEIVGPSLRLVRGVDGTIALGVEGPGGQPVALPAGSSARLPIDEVGVRDGALVVEDRGSGETWRLDHVDFRLKRTDAGFDADGRADADLTPILGPAPEKAPTLRRAVVSLRARYDGGADRLELPEIGVDLVDAAVRGSGDVAGLRSPSPQITAVLKVADFPVDALASYWPASAAAEARTWVTTNITVGRVKNAEVQVAASGGESAALTKLEGTASFDNLSVRYLDTMTRATAIKGNVRLTASSADFAVTAARVEDVAVTRATVTIPIGGAPRIAIDAEVQGPVDTVVRVLDQPPVELGKLMGVRPRGGSVSGRLGLAFPLRGGLRVMDLGLGVSADASGVSVERVIGDLSATDVSLQFNLKGDGLSLAADGRLASIAAHLDLRDRIGVRSAPQIEVKGEVDAAGWKTLGADLGGLVNGMTTVRATVVPTADGADVDATADLARASIDLPQPLPDKRQDVPGKAAARLRLASGALTAITNFDLSFTGNQLSGWATRTPAGWSALQARGVFAPPTAKGQAGKVSLDVGADGGFKLTTADLGTLLRTLGYEHGRRGNLTYQGTVSLNQPQLPFEGRLAVVDYTVVNSPLLTRLLTASSVRGLMNLFTREGIHFDRASMQLSQRDGIVTVQEGVAHSTSVTLMVDGWLDIGADALDLSGRIVPSYFGINEGIAKIPVLGSILTGKQSGAVQAIDYTAKGKISDPQVWVNPLTSIAPQVLQDVWNKLKW